MVLALGIVQANLRIVSIRNINTAKWKLCRSQEKRDVAETDADSRSDKFSGLWEPRMGKRKRNTQKSEDYYHSPAMEKEQLADFIDSVDDQWTILALKGKESDNCASFKKSKIQA